MKKIIIFIFIIILFTGCERKSISSTDFQKKMISKGFEIANSIDQFPDDVLEEAYIASSEAYNVEFYVSKTKNQAAYAYNITKSLFNSEISNPTSCKEVIKDNYAKYYCMKDDLFKLIAIINNTYILVNADSSNSKSILNIIEYLGY